MKPNHLLSLMALIVLAGCSTPKPESHPDPTVSMTPEQKIEKIQNDPNMDDGQKKIKIDTIKGEAGIK